MRTWARLIPAALLAIPFTWSSLYADAETNAQKIEKLQKDVAQLQKQIEDLRKDLSDNALRRNASTEELGRIRELLERMAVQQGVIQQRQAGYNPSSVNAGVPSTAMITVDNQFGADALVRINGQPYLVPAFRTIQVPRIPTGSFEYSVELNGGLIQSPRQETLQPPGYTIRIYRRM